jgi:hypothetical protein
MNDQGIIAHAHCMRCSQTECSDAVDSPQFQRFHQMSLTQCEARRLGKALSAFSKNVVWVDDDMQAQSDIGLAFVAELTVAVPRVVRTLQQARAGELDAVYIKGLPTDMVSARIVLTSMTHILGAPFNYDVQNGGALVMELKPISGSAGNTNATREEFGIHTDDAAVPRDVRAAFINLYGIINPPDTLTGYGSTLDALAELEASGPVDVLLKALREPRFRVRFPISFGFTEEVWSDPCAIIHMSEESGIDTRFPSYAVKPVDDDDFVAHAAIAVFLAAIERQVVNVPLDAGCFLAFNNSRGAHKRGAIGQGNRLVLRTYSAQNFELLQQMTGEFGPIFPIAPIVKSLNISAQ